MDELGTAAGTGVPQGPDPRVPSSRADRPARRSIRPVPTPHPRICARPSCASPAEATLAFVYGDRVAMLAPLASEDVPQAYDLCGLHASRTRAPRGWTLDDRRSPDEPGLAVASSVSPDLGGEHTVAVLAAALRVVPDPGPDGLDATGEQGVAAETPAADVARPATRPPLALRSRDPA